MSKDERHRGENARPARDLREKIVVDYLTDGPKFKEEIVSRLIAAGFGREASRKTVHAMSEMGVIENVVRGVWRLS